MNGYIAGNAWAKFVRANGRKIKTSHVALMAACFQIANEEGWAKEFQFPTKDAMELSCIRDKETFYTTLKDLVSFGAIRIVEESLNRYTARWVSLDNLSFYLSEIPTATPTANPSATPTATATATPTANLPIYKTKESNKTIKPINIDFVIFWDLYGKKNDREKCSKKWLTLSDSEREQAIEDIPKYIKSLSDLQYQKNPLTYLNGKCWQDEREVKVIPVMPNVPAKINNNSFV